MPDAVLGTESQHKMDSPVLSLVGGQPSRQEMPEHHDRGGKRRRGGEEKLKEWSPKVVTPKPAPGQVKQEARACAKASRQGSLNLVSVRRARSEG